MEKIKTSEDQQTADAFSTSWNNLPLGSIYTQDQFEDWLSPLQKNDAMGKDVLELGCGNGSLLAHMSRWEPSLLEGIDLGDSIHSAMKNMSLGSFKNWKIIKGDLTQYQSPGFDLVYCIGVLHHLKVPKKGMDAVIRNVKKGGKFHCWVYAREGNMLILFFVDPLRMLVSHFPWWIVKYLIAAPLAALFFLYAKLIFRFKHIFIFKKLPLYQYSLWIAKRDFSFFCHVAFDQLVSPQTAYLSYETVSDWLKSYEQVDPLSTYIIMRNGNSWKFGGKIKEG